VAARLSGSQCFVSSLSVSLYTCSCLLQFKLGDMQKFVLLGSESGSGVSYSLTYS
jgi:hypothetical protein